MADFWIDHETKGGSNRWGDISFNRLSDSVGDHDESLVLLSKGKKTELEALNYFDFSSQDSFDNSRVYEITTGDINGANEWDIWLSYNRTNYSIISLGQYEQIAKGSSAGRHIYENVLLGGNDDIDGGRYDDTLYGYAGNDSIGGSSGNDVIVGGAGLDFIWGHDGNDSLNGGADNDFIDGGEDEDTIVFSGKSSDYSIKYKSKITDDGIVWTSRDGFYLISGPDGSRDRARNIEWLQFDDKRLSIDQFEPLPIYRTINTYARSLVTSSTAGNVYWRGKNSFDVKFVSLGEDRYAWEWKTKYGPTNFQEITGVDIMTFEDQALSLANDVAATFNQVKGMDDVSGVVFRLYNAAFARLPDAKGLENWIAGNSSGKMTYATSAQEFASSQEFQNRYGATTSDTQYITTLYNNVLERSPDAVGLAHYQGLLSSGKTRGELLLDFSESPENRVLFTQVTGFS